LDENYLSGAIPAEIGNLSRLHTLDISGNYLSGNIPPELGNLIRLEILYMCYNQLSGTIPGELGNLENLKKLYLINNELSGTIPPEIGRLKKLTKFDLSNNQLSGDIPAELGDMENLGWLDLSNNQLTGSIPQELGNIESLAIIYLNRNQLTGTIPVWLGNLENLDTLDLTHNQFTGPIPPELGNIENLSTLKLNNNQLSGSIPPELGNLTSLNYLYLGHNQLSGTIPSELGNLENLWSLGVSGNLLTGNIPTSFMNLANTHLWIRYNGLYTDDESLQAFLNSIDIDWETTQTIAPSGLVASDSSSNSILLTWAPIPYSSGSGGYRVFYSSTPGGPYQLFGSTENKTVSQMNVTGLRPGTTYYFVVQTWTNPHFFNPNTISSEISNEIAKKTKPLIIVESPADGEIFTIGEEIPIYWTTFGISGPVEITLQTPQQLMQYVIKENYPFNGAPLYYTIPNNVAPGSYIVTVRSLDSLSNYKVVGSSGLFKIKCPAFPVKIISPLEGQIFNRGEIMKLAWATCRITGDVRIILCKLDEPVKYVIKDKYPYDGSPLDYMIPKEVKSGKYIVKVIHRDIVSKSGIITIR
jgi:Leucine-rich repeat (LRR) protein